MPKAQVANLIAKVETGVDEFRDYLEKRGDNAKDTASTAFGNQLHRTYLVSTKYVKNAASDAERKKFLAVVESFRKSESGSCDARPRSRG
jgi:hypothetical protein